MSGTEVTDDAVNFRNQHGARKANPSLPSSARSWVRKTGTRCNKPLGRWIWEELEEEGLMWPKFSKSSPRKGGERKVIRPLAGAG